MKHKRRAINPGKNVTVRWSIDYNDSMQVEVRVEVRVKLFLICAQRLMDSQNGGETAHKSIEKLIVMTDKMT